MGLCMVVVCKNVQIYICLLEPIEEPFVGLFLRNKKVSNRYKAFCHWGGTIKRIPFTVCLGVNTRQCLLYIGPNSADYKWPDYCIFHTVYHFWGQSRTTFGSTVLVYKFTAFRFKSVNLTLHIVRNMNSDQVKSSGCFKGLINALVSKEIMTQKWLTFMEEGESILIK